MCLVDDDLVFKALADPARRGLLDSLHLHGGQSLGELSAGHAMSRQAVTKHLDVLEKANLVVSEKRGRVRLHHLNPVPIQELADRWIGKFRRAPLRALADLKQSLERNES
jgi:DNA-binding transcriptional ArsR family regulator